MSDWNTTVHCAVLPTITSNLPATSVDISSWNIPKDLQLADQCFNQPAAIDLLLGADIFFDILCNDRQTRTGYPTLQKTELGWIISGKIPGHVSKAPKISLFVRSDNNLDKQLQRFWDIESLDQPVLSPNEKQCEAHFIANTKRLPSGKFEVRLPVKSSSTELGESERAAYYRLLQMEKKFAKNVELKTNYVNFMNEYVQLGHMEAIHDVTPDKQY